MLSRAQVLRLSQAGADREAWAAYHAGGWAGRGDHDALTLKGRLIKDRAQRAAEPERRGLFLKAAEAYAEAARLSPSAYALVNAATLALLAGEAGVSQARARAVLELLDGGRHDPDTDYWLRATRAEALLLLGDVAGAQAALGRAVAAAPKAWEDHAITLRQFRLLLRSAGQDEAWLDRYRPAPVLHFSGTMRLADGRDAAARIAAALDGIAPGAGYGALAGGSDILVAEALLARDAEVHVVLPCDVQTFRAASVAPLAGDWAARFDRLLEEAAAIEVAGSAERLTGGAIAVADAVAMGVAIQRARDLATRAVALRVVANGEDASPSDLDAAWERSGHERVVLGSPGLPTPEAPALDAGAGSTAFLAVRSAASPVSRFRFDGLRDALEAGLAFADDAAAGVSFGLADTPDAEAGLAAFAAAAAEAAPMGALYATRPAAAAAQLHGAASCVVGEVRTGFGAQELHALLPGGGSPVRRPDRAAAPPTRS